MVAGYLGLCYEKGPPYPEACELSGTDVAQDGTVREAQLLAGLLDGEEPLPVDLYGHGLPGLNGGLLFLRPGESVGEEAGEGCYPVLRVQLGNGSRESVQLRPYQVLEAGPGRSCPGRALYLLRVDLQDSQDGAEVYGLLLCTVLRPPEVVIGSLVDL